MRVLITGGAGFIGSHLVRLMVGKYPQYGEIDPASYLTGGAWMLQPRRVLAWINFPTDATRFVFR